jgi:hypothetical protein
MIPAMIASLRNFLGWLVSAFRSREDLVLENLALHQQLLALQAQRPRRRVTIKPEIIPGKKSGSGKSADVDFATLDTIAFCAGCTRRELELRAPTHCPV